MRNITKDIQLILDGSPQGFRLMKPDAFSGVERSCGCCFDYKTTGEKRNKGTALLVPRMRNYRTVPDVPGRKCGAMCYQLFGCGW